MRLPAPPSRRPRLPLTSLVDVVFILLFFFMLAAQQLDWRGLPVRLSAPSGAAVPAAQPLVVVLSAGGRLRVAGREVERAGLIAGLRAAPRPLVVVPGAGSSAQELFDLVEGLRAAGITPSFGARGPAS